MEVIIRRVVKRSGDGIKESPCSVEIRGHHNHAISSAANLNELRVSRSTIETFEKYFEQSTSTVVPILISVIFI